MTQDEPAALHSAVPDDPGSMRAPGEVRPRGRMRRWIDPEEPELVVDLLDQANRFNMRASVGSPPTVLLVVITLWGAAPHTGLLAWSACATLTSVLHITVHVAYRHRRRRSADWSTETWRRIYTAAMAVGGLLWGALPLLALPGADRPEYQSIVALFLTAFMAANSIFSSPLRRLFIAFQVPLAVVGSIGLLREDTRFSTMLAAVVLYALPFSFVLYDQANSAAVAAVRLAHRNSNLLVELRSERHRIEAANVELRDVNERLAHQAAHDALTELANRPLFRTQLEEALDAARSTGTLVGVAFLDLDRFKLVNDSLGHLVGDDLLVAVAGRVRGCLRRGDILGRQGGDEFTLLMPKLTDVDEAIAVAERIRRALHEPFVVDSRRMAVTSSIGLALNTHHDDTADDLLRHADAAMYRAKAIGRDCVELFDESLRGALARRVDDEAELRQAFADGQIVSWFQPEVDLFTGRIVGAESLARWVHPTRGVLSGGQFVPFAEECGLLSELSSVTARSGTAARVLVSDVVDPSFRVRLNVSASQIMDLALLHSFLAHLAERGLDPTAVSVEVTETALIDDVAAARTWLETARGVGITVALDDFGTGYSSLAMLAQLPLDGVKIDLGFVRELTTSATARAVVAATVELAAGLGLQVVAEGVETEEQAEALRRAGVRRAQGFLYSPAVPIETLRAWLADGPPWMAADEPALAHETGGMDVIEPLSLSPLAMPLSPLAAG